MADGIGTLREVAARALRDLRRDGVIRTAPRAIEVLDPTRLASYLGNWQTSALRPVSGPAFDASALLDASPNAVVGVAAGGDITYVNSSSESTFGTGRGELLGRKVEMLLPERLRDLHVAHRERFFVNPMPRPMGRGLNLAGRRRDGTEFPVAVSLAPLETGDGLMAFATVVDMSVAVDAIGRPATGRVAPGAAR